MNELGKLLLGMGLVLVLIGVVLMFAGRIGLPLGRLPGDIVYKGKHTTVYIPLVTCLVISILASVLMYLFSRMR